jgi:hypothetical protein
MAMSVQERGLRYRRNPKNDAVRQVRNAQQRENRLASGLCVICGSRPPKPQCVTCEPCINSRVSYRKNREGEFVAKGLCGVCGKVPSMPHMTASLTYRLCETCYLRKLALGNLGSKKLWPVIRDKLIAQDWKCAYTGELLVLSVNDSLDHIYPLSRFPERATDPTNIEWVCRQVNEMKRDRTPEEFLTMIQHILDYRLYALTWTSGSSVA